MQATGELREGTGRSGVFSDGSEHFGTVLAIIAGAGFVLRLVYALRLGDFEVLTDPNYYHLQANLLADGHGFIDPFTWIFDGKRVATAAHPPLFSLVLSIASWFGATSAMAHRVVGCAIGAGTIVTIGFLGREIAGKRAGLVAATIAAVYPNLWVFDAGVFAESLELLLVSLLLLVVYRMRSGPRWRDAIVLGALTGLLALTRSELLLLVPLLIAPAFLVRTALSWGKRFTLVGVSCLVVVVVIAPWMIRNATTFDEPVLMSTNGDLFVGYTNCSSAYSGRYLGWYDTRCAPKSVFANRTTDEAKRMLVARDRGLEFARDHVPRLVGVVVPARVARLWHLYRPMQTAELEVSEGRSKSVTLAGMAVFVLLAAAAVVGGIALRRRRDAPLWPLIVPLAVATMTAAAFTGNVRFRAVAEPSIVVLAALGLIAIVDRLQDRRAEPSPANSP